MFTDITARKKAEEPCGRSEQRWATTLASIGDAVIATDVEGRIAFMNPVAEGTDRLDAREASMKPVTEVFNIVNEQTRSEVESPVAKVLREGTVVGLANHTILVKKDGTEVPIDDSGAPIRDADGKTMGVVLVFRDITERKRSTKPSERARVGSISRSSQPPWECGIGILSRTGAFLTTRYAAFWGSSRPRSPEQRMSSSARYTPMTGKC